MENYFDNSDILGFLLKKKKQIITNVVIAAVLSALFSFFITPKYKSEAIVYPANLSPYSSETPTEQLLQLFNSKDVMDSVIKYFNLAEHYGINTTQAQSYSALVNEFKDNVSFSKTEYESVIIEVMDVHPQMASDMVNMIINMVNSKVRSLQHEKAWEVVAIKQRQFNDKKLEIDSMEAILKELRVKYGLLNYNVQVEEVVKRYLKERTEPGYNPNTSSSQELIALLGGLKEKGGEFVALTENLIKERAFYNEIKEEYELALKDAEKELTYTNVVTHPKPADNKSYPIRWLIVLIFSISTFMITVISILLMEQYKLHTK